MTSVATTRRGRASLSVTWPFHAGFVVAHVNLGEPPEEPPHMTDPHDVQIGDLASDPFAFALLVACNNPCEAMCVEMAAYADECGIPASQDLLAECRAANASDVITDARAQQCITASDADQLREWWTCEELEENCTTCGK